MVWSGWAFCSSPQYPATSSMVAKVEGAGHAILFDVSLAGAV